MKEIICELGTIRADMEVSGEVGRFGRGKFAVEVSHNRFGIMGVRFHESSPRGTEAEAGGPGSRCSRRARRARKRRERAGFGGGLSRSPRSPGGRGSNLRARQS